MRSWCVPLVVAVVVCGAGADFTASDEYFKVMKAHFDGSLKYLFKSFQFSGQAVQRPGLAHLLRQQSDRHWQEGTGFMKKYFQTGGEVNDTRFDDYFTYHTSVQELPLTIHPSSAFSSELSDFYVQEVKSLAGHTKRFASEIKSIRPHRDPDMAHFIQEKHEHEVESVRRFTLANRNLELMYNTNNRNGLALYMFDQSLQ